MEIVIGWFVFAVIVGIFASSKGRSGFGYFLLSVVLTPLITGLLVAVLPSLKQSTPDLQGATPETHVRCPDCRELVRADASKCKHCGCALVPQHL